MTSGTGSRARRMTAIAALALGGVVAVAMIAFGLMFWIGGNNVDNFCQEANPGFPVAKLPALAARHHVRLKPGPRDPSGDRTVLAHTPRSYGRHTCLVRHDGNVVIDRRFGFAD
jgi:hypothetical protein